MVDLPERGVPLTTMQADLERMVFFVVKRARISSVGHHAEGRGVGGYQEAHVCTGLVYRAAAIMTA